MYTIFPEETYVFNSLSFINFKVPPIRLRSYYTYVNKNLCHHIRDWFNCKVKDLQNIVKYNLKFYIVRRIITRRLCTYIPLRVQPKCPQIVLLQRKPSHSLEGSILFCVEHNQLVTVNFHQHPPN